MQPHQTMQIPRHKRGTFAVNYLYTLAVMRNILTTRKLTTIKKLNYRFNSNVFYIN
jgi:hypothetical protein